MRVFTVGYGGRTKEEFSALLRAIRDRGVMARGAAAPAVVEPQDVLGLRPIMCAALGRVGLGPRGQSTGQAVRPYTGQRREDDQSRR